MSVNSESDEGWGELSRELVLEVDGHGTIVSADARAQRTIGARPGARLSTLVVRGTEAKVDALLAAVADKPVQRWELTIAVAGRPSTVSFSGRQRGAGIQLVGSLVPHDYGSMATELSSALGELASLHAETTRQRNELDARNRELERLNRELSDSNRGVMALHAEIDEKTDSLRRAAEVKSRVVANVSHEFRTPLNSILGISKLILEETDGTLNDEQRKQVGFVRRAAENLSEIVSDLLDLSKIEAGKVGFRASVFRTGELFAALRGMLKPIVPTGAVELVFDDVDGLPPLETDEGKVAQILRNFVSNALKFTERGEVRVSASALPDGHVIFSVKDTGIGISQSDQQRIFEEFEQVDSSIQRRVKGTGLGLAVCRRTADILGGHVSVKSAPSVGSTFYLVVPAVHPEVKKIQRMSERGHTLEPGESPILVVEDDRTTLFLYENYLRGSGYQVVPARSVDGRYLLARLLNDYAVFEASNGAEGVRVAKDKQPSCIFLDFVMPGMSAFDVLDELKTDPRTRNIPVIIHTAKDLAHEERQRLGRDATTILNKQSLSREVAIARIREALATAGVGSGSHRE